MKDSAIVYRNFMNAVRKLPVEKQGEAYEAYLLYALDGVEYEGDDYTIIALLEAFRDKVDKDRSSYKDKCERLKRNAAKATSNDIESKSDRNRTEVEPISERNRNEVGSDIDIDIVSPEGGYKEKVHTTVCTKEKVRKPSRAEANLAIFDSLCPGYGFSDLLIGTLNEWMRYKGDDKKFSYQETGMRAFLTQVQKRTAEYGDEAVADVIALSMSNGWQGIVWEKLQGGRDSPAHGVTFMDMYRKKYGGET